MALLTNFLREIFYLWFCDLRKFDVRRSAHISNGIFTSIILTIILMGICLVIPRSSILIGEYWVASNLMLSIVLTVLIGFLMVRTYKLVVLKGRSADISQAAHDDLMRKKPDLYKAPFLPCLFLAINILVKPAVFIAINFFGSPVNQIPVNKEETLNVIHKLKHQECVPEGNYELVRDFNLQPVIRTNVDGYTTSYPDVSYSILKIQYKCRDGKFESNLAPHFLTKRD